MFTWNVEELMLLNGKSFFLGREKIYAPEQSVSREDKIAFVDSLNDGKLSYLLSLIVLFEKDRESIRSCFLLFNKTIISLMKNTLHPANSLISLSTIKTPFYHKKQFAISCVLLLLLSEPIIFFATSTYSICILQFLLQSLLSQSQNIQMDS